MKKAKAPVKKIKPVPVFKGTKTLGRVSREYVQFDVPDGQIEHICEALSHAILSDYYSMYLRLNRVTETGQDFD